MTAVQGAGIVERLGVTLHATGSGVDPAVLLGLALRRNPRRAQLLVSRVLGKHLPTDPRVVHAAGLLLGALVADALAGCAPRALPVELLAEAVGGDPDAAAALHRGAVRATAGPAVDGTEPAALVLGFAETATALGHCVAEALGAPYLHSTRRPVPGYVTAGGFVEEHSHATDHLLLPGDPDLLRAAGPLVLVDDELSSGRTALNTITALHRLTPRAHYVVAALVDARPAGDGGVAGLVAGVAALGARLDVVALSSAAVGLPADLAERATAIRGELDARAVIVDRARSGSSGQPAVLANADHAVRLTDLGWPVALPVGGRHGFGPADHARLDAALPELAGRLAVAAGLTTGDRILVLGTEELMALPLRLAQTLADAGHDVRFSTTSRSPAVVADDPGYALTSGLSFPAHDDPADGPGPRYAYNLGRPGDPLWEHVLVVVDPPADTPALRTGLLAALAPRTRATTVVVTP